MSIQATELSNKQLTRSPQNLTKNQIIIILVMLGLLAIPVLILAGWIWYFFFRKKDPLGGDKKPGE